MTTTEDQSCEDDPLLALRGSGEELWADEHADEYVQRLREGWDDDSCLCDFQKHPTCPRA